MYVTLHILNPFC